MITPSDLPGADSDTYEVHYPTGHVLVYKHPDIVMPFFKIPEIIRYLIGVVEKKK